MHEECLPFIPKYYFPKVVNVTISRTDILFDIRFTMKGRMYMKEQTTSYVHPKETLYFTIMIIVSVIMYLALALSVIGIVILISLLIISVFAHGLFIGYIRANGVKLGPNQFGHVYEKAVEISSSMGLKKVPDIYVIESSGILNAFATRFFGKNMVTIYSGVFELMKEGHEEELHFILSHELAHIKRNHIIKSLLLVPANFIPFLSEAYSRACEFTCDHLASAYTQNVNAATNGLLMLSIGKELFKDVNKEEYIRQLEQENSLFVWLSEMLSTHPPLPKRIAQLETSFIDRPAVKFKIPALKIFGVSFLVSGLFVAFAAAVTSVIYFVTTVMNFSLFPSLEESEWATYYSNDLEKAYYEDDYEKAVQLLEEGSIDLTEIFPDTNETLLHTAILHGDTVFLELLLQYTNPDVVNAAGEPLLHYAAYIGNYDVIPLLIESGADLSLQDQLGNTPLHAATSNEIDLSILSYMLENGADPTTPNNEEITPLMIAEEEGWTDVVRLFHEYAKD